MTSTLFICLLLLQAPAGAAEDRLAAVQQKARKLDPASVSELISQADKDPDASVRRYIVDRLGRLNRPEIRAMLERRASTDPDAGIAVLALERLRQQQSQDLSRLFDQRLAAAKAADDQKALAILVAEHQHWVSLGRGATLPGFLEEPPPVFSASSKSRLRVVSFGDFGVEGPNQQGVAKAVARYSAKHRVDFGLLLGDNMVPVGVTSPGDSRWKGGWEAIYDGLRFPFYATTGNHDWGLADSPAAEILYSRQSRSWRMPALYYTFTAGPAQFFALATNAMSETQLRWLDRELSRSKARWKIAYGHHPIYSYSGHGDNPPLQRSLLPILKNRVQVYLAGHDHVFQHLQPEAGVHFVVSSAAGQTARAAKSGPKTLGADSFYGFTVFEIDGNRLSLAAIDSDGKTRYKGDIR